MHFTLYGSIRAQFGLCFLIPATLNCKKPYRS